MPYFISLSAMWGEKIGFKICFLPLRRVLLRKKWDFFRVKKIIEISEIEQVCWQWCCKYFGERTPCKKLLQGNSLRRNNFSGVYKTSLHFTK
jgi:hypothetical protein